MDYDDTPISTVNDTPDPYDPDNAIPCSGSAMLTSDLKIISPGYARRMYDLRTPSVYHQHYGEPFDVDQAVDHFVDLRPSPGVTWKPTTTPTDPDPPLPTKYLLWKPSTLITSPMPAIPNHIKLGSPYSCKYKGPMWLIEEPFLPLDIKLKVSGRR